MARNDTEYKALIIIKQLKKWMAKEMKNNVYAKLKVIETEVQGLMALERLKAWLQEENRQDVLAEIKILEKEWQL